MGRKSRADALAIQEAQENISLAAVGNDRRRSGLLRHLGGLDLGAHASGTALGAALAGHAPYLTVDLAHLCCNRIEKYLPLSLRVNVPYSTEVHGGAMVKRAKERKKLLPLFRDLMVFEYGQNDA